MFLGPLHRANKAWTDARNARDAKMFEISQNLINWDNDQLLNAKSELNELVTEVEKTDANLRYYEREVGL